MFGCFRYRRGKWGYRINVFGGVMDEVNFMANIEKSSSRGGRFDQADSLYTSLIRRMKSRFMKR